MGRHTADLSSDRASRQHLDDHVVSERRAALNRTRTAETPVQSVDPTAATPAQQGQAAAPVAPKSVAANRVSPATPSDPRVVKQRRGAVARISPKNRIASAARRPATDATLNGFMRRRSNVPALSFFAVALLACGSLFNPLQADVAQAAVDTPVLTKAPAAPQQFSAHGTYAAFDVTRDGYEIVKPVPKKVVKPAPVVTATDTTTTDAAKPAAAAAVTPSNSIAAVAATPDPGSAQAIALDLVTARGWGTDQYSCLVSLWNKESGWRVNAYNPSGAYGIPQALPGAKMATAGADWQTNPATQITWGLNYISGVYGTPCGAWGHSQSFNWY